MNKISKKDFIQLLTSNESIFLTSMFKDEELDLNDLAQKLDGVKYLQGDKRTCKAFPTYLSFSNDSRLYLTNGKFTFYTYGEWVIFCKKSEYMMSGEIETSWNYIIYRLMR